MCRWVMLRKHLPGVGLLTDLAELALGCLLVGRGSLVSTRRPLRTPPNRAVSPCRFKGFARQLLGIFCISGNKNDIEGYPKRSLHFQCSELVGEYPAYEKLGK